LILKDEETPKLPNKYPFEYLFDDNKYSDNIQKPLYSFDDTNSEIDSSNDESI